ncbi:MAG TPA: hypothetical protein VGS10_15860 [Terracidiphilus sp.]|nr:hypothetical protein [Terracidiphilus sp.]
MRVPRWICCTGFAAASILAPPTAFPQADSSQSCIPIVKELQLEIVRKNMPFTGTLTVTCKAPQPDGTVARGKVVVFLWRDSEGRTRRQDGTPIFPGTEVYGVTVTDPVDHLEWHWTIGGGDKTVIVSKFGPRGLTTLRSDTYPLKPDGSRDYDIFAKLVGGSTPTFKEETLPPEYINGTYAVGQRITEIVAPGMMNNHTDHPQTVVTEDWESTDIDETVRWIVQDPSMGTNDYELQVSDRNDPDPTQFQPPPDFNVLISMPQGRQSPPSSRLKVLPVPTPSSPGQK